MFLLLKLFFSCEIRHSKVGVGNTGQFVGPIDLQVIPGDPLNWLVAQDFSYVTDAGVRVDIKAGLKTDLASTPRLVWNIYPPFGLYTGAAIVHDDLYTRQMYDRKTDDGILLEAMKAEGVSWITRHIIWSQVRLWGWVAWNEHAKQNAANKTGG